MNNDLLKDWNDYSSIVSTNSLVEYTRLIKIHVEGKKSAWVGCCYSDNGLVGITNSSREAIMVDSCCGSFELFGNLKIGTFKWTGGCEYNGICYGFPRKENSLLLIDYVNRKAYSHKLDTNYRGEHHYGGVLTSDGIVYQPPRNTDHILRIDLNTYETKKIRMPYVDSTCRYSSSVMHPSGDVYLIPEYGYRMAVLDPDTERVEYIGGKFDHLVFGAVVGLDGNIYGFSKEGNGILKINTKNRSIEFICQGIGNPDCYGAVVGINGKIYGVPGGGDTIYEFDIESQMVRVLFQLDEIGYAKCAGAGVGTNGTIVMIPCFGDFIYYLMCEKYKHHSKSMDVNNRFFNTSY